MEENFLKDEKCEQCGGPILAEPYRKTIFYEGDLSYAEQILWPCYACGHAHALNGEPHYIW